MKTRARFKYTKWHQLLLFLFIYHFKYKNNYISQDSSFPINGFHFPYRNTIHMYDDIIRYQYWSSQHEMLRRKPLQLKRNLIYWIWTWKNYKILKTITLVRFYSITIKPFYLQSVKNYVPMILHPLLCIVKCVKHVLKWLRNLQ